MSWQERCSHEPSGQEAVPPRINYPFAREFSPNPSMSTMCSDRVDNFEANEYSGLMSWAMRQVAVCEECGHEWLAVGQPVQCPSRKCRSRKWNGVGGGDDREKPVCAPEGTRTCLNPTAELAALDPEPEKRPRGRVKAEVGREVPGLAACNRCGGPCVDWGPRLRRCMACAENFARESPSRTVETRGIPQG